MLVARSRPWGRLFFLLLGLAVVGSEVCVGATPTTTTVADTVYRADGTTASGGVLLISWPSFITSEGYPVAAGTQTVTVGPQGGLSVELVSNTGATPAGTFYTVVYQLAGAVRTEYWVVPATSPAKIADVRTTLGATNTVAQMASRQYVDTAVSAKALDAAVVHLSGNELISGAKQFSAPPNVPAPQQPNDVANKAYVDEAVAEVGAGSYVSKTGDTMNGPLNLSADGYSLRYYLSQTPFNRSTRILLDEEYPGTAPDANHWKEADPANAISVSGGKLQVSGGTGVDGQTTVSFVENVELGGAVVLQHGDVVFNAASDGVVGGLFPSALTIGECVAGFRVTANGGQSKIQALVNGGLTGPAITTKAGHRYALTTRFYASEIHRFAGIFHSSAKPGGQGRGGGAIAADVRFVLEAHEIDPADPGSLISPSTVLYDGIVKNAPASCAYALINARHLYCIIAFTRILQAPDAEVRSALPLSAERTRLVGSLLEGAECLISQDPALQFFPQSVPQANELIEVRYRGSHRSLARISDAANIAAHKSGNDDGVRGIVRYAVTPPPLSSADCENAALAVLDDAKPAAWAGEYSTWSDFLPGDAVDIFPGEVLDVSAPSRGASFRAVIREVEVETVDLAGDRSRYKLKFADDAAEAMALVMETARVTNLLDILATDRTAVGTSFLAALTAAEVSNVTSTTVTVDAGTTPPAGQGFEVRRTDYGWGQDNERNLIGRFGTRIFTLPRWARVQDYFLRQYDNSNPAKYSRCSAALHIDYPL